jgi:hypothetical protein
MSCELTWTLTIFWPLSKAEIGLAITSKIDLKLNAIAIFALRALRNLIKAPP